MPVNEEDMKMSDYSGEVGRKEKGQKDQEDMKMSDYSGEVGRKEKGQKDPAAISRS
jgi:hypothetical protein